MHPVQCYFWFIYVYSVLCFQICSGVLLLIAGCLFGAYGSTFWHLGLIIVALVVTLIAVVVGFLALLEEPSTGSQVCLSTFIKGQVIIHRLGGGGTGAKVFRLWSFCFLHPSTSV